MPRVSVIVPFLNVAEYIGDCITSLTVQTFRDFDVYLVDSGSTDGTGDIARKILEDHRIPYTFLREEKSEVSEARNKGLDHARDCEFLYFIDSDDMIHPEFLETLVGIMDREKVDLAGCMLRRVDQFGAPLVDFIEPDIPLNQVLKVRDVPEVLLTQVPVCTKLFSRALVDRIPLRFADGLIYEDVHFTKKYQMHCDTVYFSDRVLYDYRQRPKSLMKNSTDRNKDIVTIYEKLFQEMQAEGLEHYRDVMTRAAIDSILIRTPVRLSRLKNPDYFREFYDMPLVRRLMEEAPRHVRKFPLKLRLIYQLVKWRQLGLLSRIA